MPLLFCPRVDIPPQMFLQDDSSTDPIESKVRLNDLFVTFVLDRDGSGAAGDLGSLSGCFGTGADLSADCRVIAACLDLDVPTTWSLDTAGGAMGIKPTFGSPIVLPRPDGAVCDGGFNFGGDELGGTASSEPVDALRGAAGDRTPPLVPVGLDLGGAVVFAHPKLIAVDTDSDPTFQDYFGVTGDLSTP
jgi:hypothetical protein